VQSQVQDERPTSDDMYSDVFSRPGDSRSADSRVDKLSDLDAANYAAVDHSAYKQRGDA